MKIRTFFAIVFCFVLPVAGFAQGAASAHEVEQMHHNAVQLLEMGNYKDAVTTFEQLVALMPDNTLFVKELGKSYLLNTDYENAITTLNTIYLKPGFDAEAFELLAKSYSALKQTKKAKAAIEKGIEKYPNSGRLYFEKGNIYAKSNGSNNPESLEAWLNGTRAEPTFAPNYKEAANVFLESDNVFWGLLLNEMYLSMPHNTQQDTLLKQILFAGWNVFFEQITEPKEYQTAFEEEVVAIYKQLTPVVSDGITTENLTMIRTRFLLAYYSTASVGKYPFYLFDYQYNMVKNGWFDMYQEWLFGKAENVAEFNAWNKFHEGDMEKFEQWHNGNEIPTSGNIIDYINMQGSALKYVCAKKKKR